MLDEFCPGTWTVDQTAVLVSLGIIPATNGQGYLDSLLFELGDLLIELCK